jgi:catechol 2,3-dioxygenase-like lactoylglutathione lyase family enzyme
MSEPALTSWIHGPIISSSDLEAHLRLLQAFGMREQSRRSVGVDECSGIWGTTARRATEVVLETPGTRYGARILQFDPLSEIVVRDRERGYDADAPKVIDFYAPDFAAARAAVERLGWTLREPIAEYDMPEGHFIEGHVWGPDEMVCALISGPQEFFVKFACITDRLFSEPQSLSGAVSVLEPSVAFLTKALGMRVVHRYGIEDDSFRQLVGSAARQFNLRAVNIGLTTEEPYIGLIHYGMPAGSYRSLAGRARPPSRGTLGATLVVRDADETARRVRSAGGTILAPPVEAQLEPFGAVRSTLFLAPNGASYLAVAPREASPSSPVR